ncbi:hypothetical protein CVT24_002385 [Panaeolus cyanescens]|uniref:F-box domain-containing protein n=1 Tax=Panaeolus cyanescens TaxID=181874 RepID=A0A409WXB5_9AGAR|nr:hypothetical protein CVT24_002385 [Panaeolus cyanescens]
MRNPTSNIPQLPLELIFTIMDLASTDLSQDQRNTLLSSCALTCRAWSLMAQKLLFSSVRLSSQRAFDSFMGAVDPSVTHARLLGEAVRELSVVLDHNQPSGLHQQSFAMAVTQCPNLRHVSISLYGCAEPGEDVIGAADTARLRRLAPSFDETTLALLHSGPQVSSLHFDNWSENKDSVYQLLQVWTGLNTLSIGGTPPQPLQESPVPFPCALENLYLNFQSSPSVEFLKWLLHNSSDSLRTLNLKRDPSNHVFDFLMEAYGSNLCSVSLPGYGTLEHSKSLQNCHQLRALWTENPSCLSTLYKHLPKSIEHVSFRLDRDAPLNSILDLVKRRKQMKGVIVHVSEGGNRHPLLPTLKASCAFRGIGLELVSDLQLYRSRQVSTS